jgi:hypothetical protein
MKICITIVSALFFSNLIGQTIYTIAGTGIAGFSGDGGAADSARLYTPEGIAVDNSGNIFIADRLNHRIRKVNALGVITTVAGNGVAGYSGDGGSALQASLNEPCGVAVDNLGNIYIYIGYP